MAELQSVRSARTRRQRGYSWEEALVKRLNKCDSWKAFRLGSPSIGLPDVVATSTVLDTMFAIEAKSGSTNSILVPADQIERCLRWLDAFGRYSNRHAILAFKFISKKWKSAGNYEKRERREYFKVWAPGKTSPCDLVCRYDGSIYIRTDGRQRPLRLEDFAMPFQKA